MLVYVPLSVPHFPLSATLVHLLSFHAASFLFFLFTPLLLSVCITLGVRGAYVAKRVIIITTNNLVSFVSCKKISSQVAVEVEWKIPSLLTAPSIHTFIAHKALSQLEGTGIISTGEYSWMNNTKSK